MLQKIQIISKNALNESCAKLNFLQKKLCECISLSILGVELEGSKELPFLKYYNGQEWESRFTLALNTAKILIILKNASNKCRAQLNFLQKFSERTSLSLPGMELGAPKFAIFYIIIMY